MLLGARSLWEAVSAPSGAITILLGPSPGAASDIWLCAEGSCPGALIRMFGGAVVLQRATVTGSTESIRQLLGTTLVRR